MSNETPLQRELEFFQQNLEEWLKLSQGKYALVHGETLLGFYDTPDNAYGAGAQKFGNEPFLIRQVVREQEPATFPALFAGAMSANP